MKTNFTKNIGPYVLDELRLAKQARENTHYSLEFTYLENAHVLGQGSTYWHTKVHILMLIWALRTADTKEFVGQLLRIVGAISKTCLGLVPIGNTGGANISPFKTLPVSEKLASKIKQAKQ
ncbi:MAG: DUF3703 domain-containing protein [Paraglaciecola sp.]|uniref:DUF3703 domain-containing protein n=1 Tax=Paraglaciecola sp. TaxID=1920173 RepID=UPI0032987C72